jgi:anti-anti-sigma factor
VRGCVLDQATVNGLTLVRLAGELDVGDGPLLREALLGHPAATLPDVAVDLGEVDFIDCAVVGVLVTVSRAVHSAGGCLRLGGLRPEPARLIAACGLDGTICVHDSATSATAVPCRLHTTDQPADHPAGRPAPRIPLQQENPAPTAV